MIDILAPDDPISTSKWFGEETGSYGRFGGTSGATPHVASAVGLYQEKYPDATTADIEDFLFSSAVAIQESVSDPYGYGRLQIAQKPAEASVWEGDFIQEWKGEEVLLHIDIPDAIVRWDLGYDGVIDDTGAEVLISPEDEPVVVWVGYNNQEPIRKRLTLSWERRCGCSSVSSLPYYWAWIGLWLFGRRRAH